MRKKLIIYAYILFLLLRFVLTEPYASIHSIISFTIPFIYFFRNRDYHLFKFDVQDTLQSLMINAGSALLFTTLILFVKSFLGEFNWVVLFGVKSSTFLKILIYSFFQEMMLRYLIQGELVQLHGGFKGVLFTSVLTGVVNYVTLWHSIIYFLFALVIGWVFEKTKDVYGATLAHFIIAVSVSVIV